MTPSSSSQVAIFWDYENCRPSNDSDGNKVIDRIQRIVQGFGSITTFRAYLDLSLDSRSSALHSDLQSSGLTLVHCPHNGKKDVADKMMIVDMLAFAIDRPTPACIVLITGDRDFAYAAAILKLRGYRIIVISPTYNSHSSLKVQAHELYDWQNDVLGTTGGTTSAISPRGHKSIGSVASASQMNEVLLSGATGPSVSQGQGRMESMTLIGAQAGVFRSLTRGLNAFGTSPLKPERAGQALSHCYVEHTTPPPTFAVTPTTRARADSASLSDCRAIYGNTANAALADEVSSPCRFVTDLRISRNKKAAKADGAAPKKAGGTKKTLTTSETQVGKAVVSKKPTEKERSKANKKPNARPVKKPAASATPTKKAAAARTKRATKKASTKKQDAKKTAAKSAASKPKMPASKGKPSSKASAAPKKSASSKSVKPTSNAEKAGSASAAKA